MTIESLAGYMGVSILDVYEAIGKGNGINKPTRYQDEQGREMDGGIIGYQDRYQSLSRALIEKLGILSLSDRFEAEDWYRTLKTQAVTKGYQVGIVKEVNGALGQMISSGKEIGNLAKMLSQLGSPPTKGTTINQQFVNGTEPTNVANHKMVTVDQAVELIESHTGPDTDTDYLFLKHGIADLPSVKALPSDAQGIGRTKDPVKIAEEDTRHIDRRAEELGVVDEEL